MSNILPQGFSDLLPDEALRIEDATAALIKTYREAGFKPVRASLVEFNDAKSPIDTAQNNSRFALLDPETSKLIAFRDDITKQVARIASSSLKKEERPLKLYYNGIAFAMNRKKGRQRTQSGAEIFGKEALNETLQVLQKALTNLGFDLKDVTIDFCKPSLLTEIFDKNNISENERNELAQKIQNKQFELIDNAELREEIIRHCEDCNDEAIQKSIQATKSLDCFATLAMTKLECNYTLTPFEQLGFSYQTGICFSVFINGKSNEIARGGEYEVNGETACGFSFDLDELIL